MGGYFRGLYWDWGYIGVILGILEKEKGNYYLGFRVYKV